MLFLTFAKLSYTHEVSVLSVLTADLFDDFCKNFYLWVGWYALTKLPVEALERSARPVDSQIMTIFCFG